MFKRLLTKCMDVVFASCVVLKTRAPPKKGQKRQGRPWYFPHGHEALFWGEGGGGGFNQALLKGEGGAPGAVISGR